MLETRRVLVVDDNAAIHEVFASIFAPREAADAAMSDLEADLFGDTPTLAATVPLQRYRLEHAQQGLDAVEIARVAAAAADPISLAFVDVRMPPGIDGIETITRMWQVDPSIEVVVCSAYSDYAWEDILRKLGASDQLLVLDKPFDAIEVEQAALALTRKWCLRQETVAHAALLEQRVAERTEQLRREAEERLQLEADLRHAQKLEAVGRLAAGVAHEINTPVQFVGDGIDFIQEAFADLMRVLDTARRLVATSDEAAAELARVEADADIEFLAEELPAAFQRTVDGLSRVTEIVLAMRGFARVDGDRGPADINRGLQDTLTVARNEYKLIADVRTDLGDLPSVLCHAGDLNQVFLNLIVNAAHAIEDRVAGTVNRGVIHIATRAEGDQVVVEIDDDGVGITPDVRSRMFDPFFTTKEVGRGTGQGLAISRAIVVDKHHGTIDCESTPGEGTRMRIRIPVEAA